MARIIGIVYFIDHLEMAMAMPQDDVWIILYTTDIFVRYKSEWDPRVHANTKGGYLEGRIRVPEVEKTHGKSLVYYLPNFRLLRKRYCTCTWRHSLPKMFTHL